MIMKHNWASSKILILGACLFLPSLANAHGITNQSVAPFFLVADFVILALAIATYALSNGLRLRWSILFSGINIAVTMVGILSSVITIFGAATRSPNDEFSFFMLFYPTSYVAIAVPLHFVVLLLLAGVMHLFKKPGASKRRTSEFCLRDYD